MALNYEEIFGDDFLPILKAIDEGLPDDVERMVLDRIDQVVFRTDIFSDEITRTVQALASSGVSQEQIENILAQDMANGGKIFGGLRNGVKEEIVNTMNQASRLGQFEEYGLQDNYMWVTVGGHKICSDCDSRAGKVKSYDDWAKEGLPGSGWSLCGGYCYCVIDPVGKMDTNIKVPKDLKAEKGATVKKLAITDLKMGGKHTNLKDAITWMEKNNVVNAKVNKMSLPIVNTINNAISQMPSWSRKNLVISNFKDYTKQTGHKFTRQQLKNYGVSFQQDAFDYYINQKDLPFSIRKELAARGGKFNIVGYNTQKYKNLKDMAIRKRKIDNLYFERTGNNYYLNLYEGSTYYHELGHIVHYEMTPQLTLKWEQLAKDWIKTIEELNERIK